jgi:hypothetical protein
VDDADAERDDARARRYSSAVGWDPGVERRKAYRIQSYRAERVFAEFIGAKGWVRDANGFGSADVAGWSVRLASRPGYGLVIHDRDGGYPYALVEGVDGAEAFRVVGWISAEEARQLRERGVGFALPGTTKPWVIPQVNLHGFPMEPSP